MCPTQNVTFLTDTLFKVCSDGANHAACTGRKHNSKAAWVDSPRTPVCKEVEDSWLISWRGNGGKASRSQWNQQGVGLHEEGGGEAGHVPQEGGGAPGSKGWKPGRACAKECSQVILCAELNDYICVNLVKNQAAIKLIQTVFVYLYCVFACWRLGNIVFEVLVPFPFQKYSTCWVYLQIWPNCICVFVYLYLCVWPPNTFTRPIWPKKCQSVFYNFFVRAL